MAESEKLDLILQKISDLDEKVDLLEEKVDRLEEKVDHLEEKVDNIDKRVSSLETEMKEVRQQVTKTNLVIENEIRVNIQRVAEGHLDLSRNLHDAMRPSTEVEMLAIKVRMLESDVRELKSKIS